MLHRRPGGNFELPRTIDALSIDIQVDLLYRGRTANIILSQLAHLFDKNLRKSDRTLGQTHF